MATFFIRTNGDRAYDSIMESVMSRGLTHSKSIVMGNNEIEIIGSPADFTFFLNKISEINSVAGGTVAIITEGI
jgi:hypothetical protein